MFPVRKKSKRYEGEREKTQNERKNNLLNGIALVKICVGFQNAKKDMSEVSENIKFIHHSLMQTYG